MNQPEKWGSPLSDWFGTHLEGEVAELNEILAERDLSQILAEREEAREAELTDEEVDTELTSLVGDGVFKEPDLNEDLYDDEDFRSDQAKARYYKNKYDDDDSY